MAAPKRKISVDSTTQQPPKKKSPLFNQPQNYYAPPSISTMSKEELSAWRKEQRRKRNRESAAASRNKTRARIEELEGEVNQWKSKYADLEMKMRCMERHIQFLIASNNKSGGGVVPPPMAASPPPTVSHPNSPPRSPQPHGMPASVVVPNACPSSSTRMLPPPPAYSSHHISSPAIIARTNANPFPALLSSETAKVVDSKVEKHEAFATAPTPVAVAANVVPREIESRKHLSTSRQA